MSMSYMKMDNSNMKEDLSHDELWDDTLLIQQYDSTMEQLRRRAVCQMQNLSSGGNDSPFNEANSSQVPATQGASASKEKKNKPMKKKNARTEWQVGGPCRCEFSEDGEIYEATVTNVDRSSNMATVTYLGYGNTETVPLNKLFKSNGPAARQQQEAEAGGDEGEESGVGEDENSNCSSKLTAPHSRSSRCRDSAVNSSSTATTRSSSCSSYYGAFMPGKGGVLPDLPPPPPLGMSMSGLDDSDMMHTLLMSWYMTGYHTGYYRGVRSARHRHRHH
ncbi:Survival motor neuron [Trinorchestia longiramus]|nr:Survival motor neuron [Trinorchestia longiramus]